MLNQRLRDVIIVMLQWKEP